MSGNTRIAVPCSPEFYDAVSFLAKSSGVSRGRYLADLCEVAAPSIIRLAALGRSLEALSQAERDHASEIMQGHQAALETALTDVSASLEGTASSADPSGQDEVEREESRPPYSNTGVHFGLEGGSE